MRRGRRDTRDPAGTRFDRGAGTGCGARAIDRPRQLAGGRQAHAPCAALCADAPLAPRAPAPRLHSQVKEFELKKANFSETGNFGFGINEHIDLGVKYDPATGIFGMDFYVVLGRKGFRVARRKHAQGRIGARHKVSKAEAQQWFLDTYEGIFTS